MATAPTYCTHRQLKDVFPQVNSFDTKRPIYGWEETGTSNLYLARNCGLVTQLFASGEDLGDAEANSGVVNANTEWYYDSNLDTVYYFNSASNPNDLSMEAGEDFATLITRITANASRYLDAKLDPNLPKEQLKDKEGNFDYIIIRTTALIAATFLIRSHDPTSEVAIALMEDAQGNIDSLNKGGAALSWQTTGDSSKGVIREVGTISGALRPVDTRGRWSGTFDIIKVKIIDAGAIGTATYSVWTKGNDKLGVNEGNQVVTAEIIDGDYQPLAGGLQIRFGGSAYNSAASANDTWEIEVAGWSEEVDNSTVNSVRMTRR